MAPPTERGATTGIGVVIPTERTVSTDPPVAVKGDSVRLTLVVPPINSRGYG